MRRKPPDIDFGQETAAELSSIRAKAGQQVPISLWYVLGPRATLESIDGELATLVFPNGARLVGEPLRDLTDDSGFWKRT